MQLLADMGADVINIERPGTGDFNRTTLVDPEVLGGEAPYFLALNRNKRSLTLDMKHPKVKEIVTKLVQEADVLISNFRPGVLEKLGFGFEAAKEINPKIIYAEAVGYGSTGPYADLPGQDFLAQCMGGYTTIVGPEGPPLSGGTFLVDLYSAAMLANGIQAALINVMRGGGAQRVETNLLSSALHLQSHEFVYYLNTGDPPKRPEGYSAQAHSVAPYGIYQTKDGYIGISVVPLHKVALFEELVGVTGLQELMKDTRACYDNRNAVYPIVASGMVKQDTAYWLEKFQAEDIWCAKVNDYEEVVADPQVIHNNIIQTVKHPTAGEIKLIACPIYFSETPAEIRLAPPMLGEHTAEILGEIGYSATEIDALQAEGLF